MTELLRVEEAGRVLGLSRSRIYSLIKAGRIPHLRIGPRGLRVPRAALIEWMEEQTMRPAAVPVPYSDVGCPTS